MSYAIAYFVLPLITNFYYMAQRVHYGDMYINNVFCVFNPLKFSVYQET